MAATSSATIASPSPEPTSRAGAREEVQNRSNTWGRSSTGMPGPSSETETSTPAGVAVEDDGPGIPAPDLALVFERMYTSTRAASRQVGSGLGLAIVAELVAAMGGTVRAESPTSGAGGTRMVVTLPNSLQ